jgi:uncharacterized membrane protein YdbT with pleckstrin-like domain
MSGYVERNLHPGETICYRGQVSWVAALHRGVIAIIVAFVIAGSAGSKASSALSVIITLLFIGGIASLISGVFFRKWSEYVVTDRRVIGKYGVIRQASVDVLLTAVAGASVSNTVLGRVFGYGDVSVNGSGTRQRLRDLKSPKAFQSAVHERLEASRLLKGTAAYTLDVRLAADDRQEPTISDPQPAAVPTTPASARFCRQCGTAVTAAGAFCQQCGSSLG